MSHIIGRSNISSNGATVLESEDKLFIISEIKKALSEALGCLGLKDNT